MKNILLIGLLLLTGTVEIVAQKSSDNGVWNKIGGSTVDFKSETEEILITDADRFHAIKLSVSEAPILLESFDVQFANGEKQTVEYGGYDAVELNGNGRRVVTKITLHYKRIDDIDKRARVELLGMKTYPNKNDSKIASK